MKPLKIGLWFPVVFILTILSINTFGRHVSVIRKQLGMLREQMAIHPLLWNCANLIRLPFSEKEMISHVDAAVTSAVYLIGDCAAYHFKGPKLMLLGGHVDTFARWIPAIPCNNPQALNARIFVMCGGIETREGMPAQNVAERIDRVLVPKISEQFPNSEVIVVAPYDIIHTAIAYPDLKAVRFMKDSYNLNDNWHFNDDGAKLLSHLYPGLPS